MSTQAKPPPKQGSKTSTCLCKAVSFTVSGVDKGAVLCHCSNCQKVTGSAFAHNYRFLQAKIDFHQGEDAVVEYQDNDTKSGKVLRRHFCRTCGSSLFIKGDIPNMVILYGGSAQDKTQPTFELFPENRQPWVGELTKKKETKI